MKNVITIFLLLISLKAHPQCTNLDIVLVADYSGSVRHYESFVSDAILHFAEELTLPYRNDVRLGIVMFADDADVVCKPDNDYWKNLQNVNKYDSINAHGSTNIELALQTATIELLREQNSRRKLIILITDGDVTVGTSDQTIATAKQIQNIGIGICGVLIKNIASRPEFMQEVSDCYVETDYTNLALELKKLNICL